MSSTSGTQRSLMDCVNVLRVWETIAALGDTGPVWRITDGAVSTLEFQTRRGGREEEGKVRMIISIIDVGMGAILK